MTTSTSEPGTRLGGRYRLEDRIAAGAGWAAWKAIDEILARAVTVFTFAPGFPRITDVVTAARVASRLNDPRLAQVFDVEDAWDRAYIVMEWATGETLADLLSDGPLDPSRGARMIAEAAAALSTAHAAGVAHMCLSPGSLRWSHTGEVKVVGLGIDAALSGRSADDPVLADTQGLGRLLYATLTAHWPGPDYPALPAAPMTGGQPCSPRQVCAGVPASLSELTCKALQLHTRDAGDAVSSPGELARALLAAAAADPPPPAARPPARSGGRARHAQAGDNGYDLHRQGGPGSGMTDPYADPAGYAGRDRPAWQPGGPAVAGGRRRRLPGGRGSKPKAAIGAVALAGMLALSAVLAFSGLRHTGGKTGGAGSHSPRPAARVSVLAPRGATGFDPLTTVKNDPYNENSQYAKYAIDSSPTTAWQSQWYLSAFFGSLKTGSGLIVDMGRPVKFSSVTVNFGPVPGADVQIRAGNSNARTQANLNSMTAAASAGNVSGTRSFTVHATGRYLVIWFTKLPPKSGSHGKYFMAQVFNIIVRGTG